MVKYYGSLDDNFKEWIMAQSVFFVASAPTYGKHVNLSPKGLPASSFSILSPNQCAYVDASGSGNETISHINENGRVTIMLCSFGMSPRIMRLFCRGRVVEWDREKERDALLQKMAVDSILGARAIIVFDIFKVQTSCGFGVPFLGLGEDPNDASKQIPVFCDRDTIGHWAKKKIEKDELNLYQAQNNVESLDGLPGLRSARKYSGEKLLFVKDAKVHMMNSMKGLWHVVGAALLVTILSSLATVAVLFRLGLLNIESHGSKGRFW